MKLCIEDIISKTWTNYMNDMRGTDVWDIDPKLGFLE